MDILQEEARAKVNLTLEVLGRRGDGYHEISSLTAFAKLGDRLELVPGDEFSLAVEGPFAAALGEGENIIAHAARLFVERFPGARIGAFRLDKRLPVAAGLGGGSADAAAALRLLQLANPWQVTPGAVETMAGKLGSDVTVCLGSRAAHMRSRGDELAPVESLPALSAVLVNPGVTVNTREVYAELKAPALTRVAVGPEPLPRFAAAKDLARYVAEAGNDLQPVAMKLTPVVADVLAALSETEGCLAAQMSGSGPTCFGIFGSAPEAERAANTIARINPGWWVRETKLS